MKHELLALKTLSQKSNFLIF